MADVTQEFLTKGLDSLSLKDVEGVTPRLSETLIASQLNQLSVKDRDFVLQDIHGVADLIDENPAFVQESLKRLQEELDKLIVNYQNNNPHKACALELAMKQEMNASFQGMSERQRPQCSLFRATFRLSFLRAEQFDAKKAAHRLFQYFEEKLNLFGPENLTKDILIQDLDEETTECLECGRMQLLPQRDRAGRAVLVGIRKLHREFNDLKSLFRAFWYLGTVAGEDEETQKKGVVIVQYLNGTSQMSSKGVIFGLGRVLKALPLRAASIHACVSDPKVKAAATVAALLIGASNTVRFRCHSGSDMEVQYALMTFGLPINDVFPVSPMGDVDLSHHTQFLQQRKSQESMALSTALFEKENKAIDGGDWFLGEVLPLRSLTERAMASDQSDTDSAVRSMEIPPAPQDTSPALSILSMGIPPAPQDTSPAVMMSMGVPSAPKDTSPAFSVGIPPAPNDTSPVNVRGEFDILLGRGKSFQNHKGNLRYRQIVESYRERYESMGTKREKTRLIKEVVQVIFDGGGRFLRQDSVGRWLPVDLEMSRDKVSHSFRNQRRLSQKAQNAALNAGRSNDAVSKQARDTDREDRDSKRARSIGVDMEEVV